MDRMDVLSWGVATTCLLGSFAFPNAVKPIWITGIAVLLPVLYIEIRKPVNYESLKFDSHGFHFKDNTGGNSALEWTEVTDVFYRRMFNPFANQIDTEWEFHTKNGHSVVLVEWPQSKPFSRAVVANLKIVSPEKVKRMLRIREEGRWRCTHA